MADIFSKEIHTFLSQKIQLCEKEVCEAEEENDVLRKSFIEGKLHELHFFRQYLTEHFDLKNRRYY